MNRTDSKSMLRSLLNSRNAGVLATSRDDRPYANVVAFSVSEDLSEMVFATPRQSRKYENLTANPRVAVLIDNRENETMDFQNAIAATTIGEARELTDSDRERCLAHYTARHPELNDFARETSTAVFKIAVEKYVMVSRFQNVVEIVV